MNDRAPKKTPEMMAEATRLRSLGLAYETIGRTIGIGGTTAHCWLDPAFAANRRHMINRSRAGKNRSPQLHRVEIRPSPEDIERGFRSIPKDTRDLTARLCGDPLPGRRAIDIPHTAAGIVTLGIGVFLTDVIGLDTAQCNEVWPRINIDGEA